MRIMLTAVGLCLFVTACSTSNQKITKSDLNDSRRIIYGKIKDLNPEANPLKLQMTYTTTEAPRTGAFDFDNKYPFQEPKSDYFWVSVPRETTYFGVSSIRFAITGVDGEALIRDDKSHRPLFGVSLPKGTEPVYIGEITIRSGMRKYAAQSLDVEAFDLKEAYIRNNPAEAKEFLDKNGIDSGHLVILPFKFKTFQEAQSHKTQPRRRM